MNRMARFRREVDVEGNFSKDWLKDPGRSKSVSFFPLNVNVEKYQTYFKKIENKKGAFI